MPADLQDRVLASVPLCDALREVRGIDDVDSRGAIYFLSEGRRERDEIPVDAVRMALISIPSEYE